MMPTVVVSSIWNHTFEVKQNLERLVTTFIAKDVGLSFDLDIRGARLHKMPVQECTVGFGGLWLDLAISHPGHQVMGCGIASQDQ